MNATYVLSIVITNPDNSKNQLDLRCFVPTIHAAVVVFNSQINTIMAAFKGHRKAKDVSIKFGQFLGFRDHIERAEQANKLFRVNGEPFEICGSVSHVETEGEATVYRVEAGKLSTEQVLDICANFLPAEQVPLFVAHFAMAMFTSNFRRDLNVGDLEKWTESYSKLTAEVQQQTGVQNDD